MLQIRTLVYFDLEATGLKSSGKPRISEMSLVAVKVEDVLELKDKISRHLTKIGSIGVEDVVPRVLNKLTICVYPMTTIMPAVSNITGLDNYNLTDQARFDMNTTVMLKSFLHRLPAPVCLVAHNGDKYDFPLLKAELEKIGGTLGTDILCADSYIGLQEILKNRKITDDKRGNLPEEESMEDVDREVKAATELLSAGEFDIEMELPPETCTPEKRSGEVLLSDKLKIPKLENESTPSKFKYDRSSKLKQVQISSMLRSRKKLKFPSHGHEMPQSYSLINLHKHFLGEVPFQSHGAEADCLALLRTTAMMGREWVDWVADNCYVFMDCEKMWSA